MAEHFTSHSTDAHPITPGAMMQSILLAACPAGDGPDAEGWATYYIETHCTTFRIVARHIVIGRVKADTEDGWYYPTPPAGGLVDGWQIREYGVAES